MKRKDITREAIRRSSERAAAASAALENRSVPFGYVRTERVERLLEARKQTTMGLTPGIGEAQVASEGIDAQRDD